jgi:hypothetical protein
MSPQANILANGKPKVLKHRKGRADVEERRLRQIDAAGFVKADGQIELFALGPQAVIVGIAPFFVIDMVGANKNAAKAVIFHRAANLLDSAANVVRRNHGDAEHALGIELDEVVQPVVVGARDGRGEVRV